MDKELERQDLIELKFVANEFNRILGSNYTVGVNGRTSVSKTDNIDVLFQATRMPFAITGIGSETLDINIEIWAPCGTSELKERIQRDMNKLLGHMSGVITTDILLPSSTPTNKQYKTYNYASFMELSKPMSSPVIDTGTWKQLFTITGTMLLTLPDTGAIISNELQTFATFEEPTSATVWHELAILGSNYELNKAFEAPMKADKRKAYPMVAGHSSVLSISGIMRYCEIDKQILEAVELVDSALEKIIYIRREYPFGLVSLRRFLIVGGNITEQAGAYLTYNLSLQEKEV